MVRQHTEEERSRWPAKPRRQQEERTEKLIPKWEMFLELSTMLMFYGKTCIQK
jgi:hypothetical protein